MDKVFRLELIDRFTLSLRLRLDLGLEAERLVPHPSFNNLLKSNERAAADETAVGRVELREFLLWMLAAAASRDVRRRAFKYLQECLLDTFTRNVASDRRVIVFPADLIDLVNVDDSLLCLF